MPRRPALPGGRRASAAGGVPLARGSRSRLTMRARAGAGVWSSLVAGVRAFATAAFGTASGSVLPEPTSPVATATTATALQMEPAVDASGRRPSTGV